MRAAIYSRKSKFTEKGDSIENQITLCEEYGKSIGITEFTKYEDEGFSGGNVERPQFQAMMKDARSKKFDVLICYRLDRISRNVSDFTKTIDELKNYNISFISIREQFDTTSPMGRAMMNIAAVFAQLERETIAERIKDNMLELAKTGRWLGGTPPLGYRSEAVGYIDDNGKAKKMYKLSLVNEEIKIVKLIYEIFLQKKSYSSTANYLCKNNYKGKNGGEFSRHTIQQIITNPVYCIGDDRILSYFKDKGATVTGYLKSNNLGLMVYNKREAGKYENPVKEWIISIGEHEAVIDSETWIRCSKIQNVNNNKVSNKTSTGDKFLLSGLLTCGKCGNSMISWSHFDKKNSRLNRYYRCSLKQRASNRCSSKMLNADYAEDYILEFIGELDSTKIIKELRLLVKNNVHQRDDIKEIENLKKEIDTNNKTIQGLIRKLALMDDDTEVIELFKKEIDSIKVLNKKLNNKIQVLSNNIHSPEDELAHLKSFSEALHNLKELSKFLTVKECRDIILSLVDHITWNSEKRTLEVNWKFDELAFEKN